MLLADDFGREHGRRGRERIDGGIDALLDDRAGKLRCGVKVGKGRGRGRIGVVVGRNVDGLHRCDGSRFGGGDAFLKLTHLGGHGRLITRGGRDAPEQRRDLGTCLGETEDVVNEEEHVLIHLIAEMLSDRKR